MLGAARQRGIQITAGQYLRVGLLTTPPRIAVAALLLLLGARAGGRASPGASSLGARPGSRLSLL